MLIVKLIYLIVAIASGMFFILYRDVLALILFLVIVAIPVFLFISVVIMRLAVSLQIESSSNIINKGDTGHIVFKFKNRFLLPVIRIRGKVKFKNHFFDKTERQELSFFAGPMSERSFDVEVYSEHMGNVTVYINNLNVFDYFGVFSLPLKVKREYSFQIIPQVLDLNVQLSKNMYTLSESNIFSKTKPGDDPSEVFQIRDYVGGDKLNRIHWKLSSKQDHFMVKDYSLPVSEAVLIAVDLCCDLSSSESINLADTVLEAAFSLSNMFIERGTVHSMGWYNSRSGTVYTYKIESLDDLYSAFGLIYNSTTFYTEPYMAQLDMEHQQNMSHIIYIAPNVGEKNLELLNSTRNPACIFALLSAVPENESQNVLMSDEFNIIPLPCGKVGAALYDITL